MSVQDLPETLWRLRDGNSEAQNFLIQEFGVSPIISQIILSREIGDADNIKRYLFPSLNDLHNPFLMRDMKKAAERVIRALHRKEKIVVYGDYDADGITSVVALLHFLRKIYEDATFYIPDRVTEGYGLNRAAIERFHAAGTKLIIAVDCGMANHEEISLAQRLGMDVIILDHHEPSNTLPPAEAVVNPKRSDCHFPFKNLAAVGIVFNFLIALRGLLRNEGFWNNNSYPNLRNYLDLVALGTIGDIVPLVDENRIFVKFGLELVSQGLRVGVHALKIVCSMAGKEIKASDASFSLIPRINAAGRIASAGYGVELLLSENPDEALHLAMKLEEFNKKRQSLERAIFTQLEQMSSKQEMSEEKGTLIFSSPDWHPGVIGIVASKLADRFGRPAILISLKDGLGKGSGRSVADFNLFEGIKQCASYLVAYGGHRYAAGLLIEEKSIASFSRQLNNIVSEYYKHRKPAASTQIDAECVLSEINYEFLSQMQILAPFGSGNPEPILCTRDVNVSHLTIVGNNHLKMRVSKDGSYRDSIWFNKSQYIANVGQSVMDIVFTPQINIWNGSDNIQLRVRDAAIKNAPAIYA